jgi:hypothetical protein
MPPIIGTFNETVSVMGWPDTTTMPRVEGATDNGDALMFEGLPHIVIVAPPSPGASFGQASRVGGIGVGIGNGI